MAGLTWLALFPGQGAQRPGMAEALGPEGRERLLQADEALGEPLSRLVDEGPAEELTLTRNAQPALLAVGVALYEAWRRLGLPAPAAAAGHSLGEITALTAAGSLRFPDAVRLVRLRGEAMQAAVPSGEGAMAALLGEGDLDGLLDRAAGGECLVAANLNAPGQTVVSGHAGAVGRAVSLAGEAGFRRAVPLAVSAPFHSPLMAAAARALAEALEAVEVLPPAFPVASNASGGWHGRDPAEVKGALVAQVDSPVRWTENMSLLAREDAEAWVDVGPGKVVAGLAPRDDPRPKCHRSSPPEGIRWP